MRAIGAGGEIKFGSGVMVAPERVATACHVTRHAATIEVIHEARRWVAQDQIGSLVHDLCVLIVPAVEIPVAQTRRSEELRAGERVIAAGFQGSGRDLVVSRGAVVGLYRYDSGQVIRTTASFDFGSSGGGLFDEAGNLVGLLAFKGRTGQTLRFALPSEWLSPVSPVAGTFTRIERSSMARAFWEQPQEDRPAFLGVAMREAAEGYE